MKTSRELKLTPFVPSLQSETLSLLQSGIEEGVFPGAVAAYAWMNRPGEVFIHALGSSSLSPKPHPMQAETLFDVASISKVMGPAALIGTLVDRGWLEWDTPVVKICSDFPHPEVRLSHLLSHTAGYIYWRPYFEEMQKFFSPAQLVDVPVTTRKKWIRDRIFSEPLEVPPGTRCLYSDLSFLILGFFLEDLLGQSLDVSIGSQVFERLGLQDTHYRNLDRSFHLEREESIAATEICPWRGQIQGQVHDDNAWAMGGVAGHAGIFASARDVIHFGTQVLGGGFSSETRAAFFTAVSSPLDCVRTLGWDGVSPGHSSTGSYFSKKSIGHLGFTGTSLWIDPEVGLVVTLLTNRVNPSRSNEKIRTFRPRFHDALRRDLARL